MEVCINVVNYDMVWQMSLASTEYEKGVNEFKKAGFTELPSDLIRAPRVKESPVQFECKVREVIETGTEGGAANLIICEILKMHISETVLDAEGHIDQNKIQLVARLGGDWYAKAFGDALFEIEKPIRNKGIGVDQIPESIRLSTVLTGNNLGQLGNIESLPTENEISHFIETSGPYKNLILRFGIDPESLEYERHLLAKEYLLIGDVKSAWMTLLG
ncbi:MAG: flavin reductase family protein, partial [Bacteroidia bacterium]